MEARLRTSVLKSDLIIFLLRTSMDFLFYSKEKPIFSPQVSRAVPPAVPRTSMTSLLYTPPWFSHLASFLLRNIRHIPDSGPLHRLFAHSWLRAFAQAVCTLLTQGLCTDCLHTPDSGPLHRLFAHSWLRAFAQAVCTLLTQGLCTGYLHIHDSGPLHRLLHTPDSGPLHRLFAHSWHRAFAQAVCTFLTQGLCMGC